MTTKTRIDVRTCWDKAVVPVNESRKRGLIVEIGALTEYKPKSQRAVNLSLVIDRSGSMGAGRLDAAKVAAIDVVNQLDAMDILSIVEFDDSASVLMKGQRMNPDGRKAAVDAIRRLVSGGTTNLAGGWLKGATLAAEAMEQFEMNSGHVVLLSDGHANVGIQDPKELQGHADEMASRGITTSAVGIGDGYSPLQLEALSEGGLGRLHDAANPQEIAETILGEIRDVKAIVATDLSVKLQLPPELRGQVLANYRSEKVGNSITVYVGNLLACTGRSIPFMIDVPALPQTKQLALEIVVTGRDMESGESIEPVESTVLLSILPREAAQAVLRDSILAERIALMWQSTVSLEAMRMNERGDWAGAAQMVRDCTPTLQEYSDGTAAEGRIRRSLRRVEQKVAGRWEGRTKRESMVAARKFSKGERDHRSSAKEDWHDLL